MRVHHKRINSTTVAVAGAMAWACATSAAFGQGATRSLATYTEPSVTFTVSIALQPPVDTLAIGIEDSPPPGWTQITNITNGGTYDAGTHKVKWGPIFSPLPTQVAYDLTPPAVVNAQDCFTGTVSFNGLNEPIVGDECFMASVPALSTLATLLLAILLVVFGRNVIVRRRLAE